MSTPSFSELVSTDSFNSDWEHYFGHLVQDWSIRDQVSTALRDASAAFAAQITQPDGYKYMEACDRLAKFLDLNILMEQSEQKLLVQVLQIACAMHENAINNQALTNTQRSSHHLASVTLHQLCKHALEGTITHPDLWYEVFSLSCRAEKAVAKATEALDLNKYLDFGEMKDDCFGETSTALPATPRVSVDPCQTPTSLKEKALTMLNDQSPKSPSLGRTRTVPSVLSPSPSTPSPRFSRTERTPSKSYSRGGLQVLQTAKE